MKLPDGRIVDHKITDDNLVKVLESLIVKPMRETRVRLWYGENGEAWAEEHDVLGYISHSTGIKPCLILCYNRSSMGGGAILTDCIVRIDTTRGQTLYKHPNFKTNLTIEGKEVHHKDKIIARFESSEKAHRYFDFMEGNIYQK